MPAGVGEQGKVFHTCTPVRFRALRNTAPSPYFGDKYQQDIEPAGRYMVHNESPGDLARDWESSEVELQCPLVIEFNPDWRSEGHYGSNSWKARLQRFFNAKGASLTRKLRRAGYDGIVTVFTENHETREIVQLPTPEQLTRRRKR
jgi:hypothetical protein